jgi:hypothetical protein
MKSCCPGWTVNNDEDHPETAERVLFTFDESVVNVTG